MKQCLDHCPKCGVEPGDITWDDRNWDGSQVWQDATCEKCGCEFREVYEYIGTEINGE